jgi:cytoskeletal protein CcmA (bactofilin family)
MRAALVSRCRRLALALLVTCAPAWSQAPPAPAAERNVYSGGTQVRPQAPVPGDYAAMGGRVVVDQPVGGDVSVAGGAIDIRAPVGDDLRAAGGDVHIDSSVGGELFVTAGSITLAKAAVVGRGARLYGSDITLAGRVDGSLQATAQTIRITGEVLGDVQLDADAIELGPGARIGGALRYTSSSELKQGAGATVAGGITREAAGVRPQARERERPRPAQRQPSGFSWLAAAMSYLALLACGAIFLAVLPAFGVQVAQRARTAPVLALAIGFATVVALPVLVVLLFVTLIGIPVGIVALMLYPVLLLAGFVAGVLMVARFLPAALRQPAPAAVNANLGYFALALLLVMLAGAVPVVGGVLVAVVSLLGTGAFVLELYRRRRPPQRVENP